MQTLPTLSVDLVQAVKRSESFLASESVEKIKTVEERYRKFLFLISKYPSLQLAPSRDIDEFWHLHMLNPRAYYEDCMRLFGDILDHDGGFGLDASELPELMDVFEKTADLWKREFGDSYVYEADSSTSMKKCVKACRVACRRACKVRQN